MSKISRFIFGAYLLNVPSDKLKNVLNVLITNGIPFGKTRERNDSYTLCLTKRGFRSYVEKCGGEFLFDERASEVGFSAVLGRYKLRFGMFIGMLIFALSVSLSSLFVWDINIVGNVNITENEILERLDAYGFRLGAFSKSLDTRHICDRIILEKGDISFMSINMKGTVATVVIHESNDDDRGDTDASPSNLVSSYDAQIERIEVIGGVSEIKPLQTVKKGELLISGIIDSNAVGYRLVRARGKVFGKVELSFESEIPLVQTEKRATGEKKEQKNIKFFSKTLNLSKKINIPYEKYDTIVNERKLFLFGIIELPIFIVTKTYEEYEETTVTLSRNEAYEKALSDIEKQSEDVLFGAEILSRKMTLSENADTLKLSVNVECIIDIAQEVKIETARR